MIIQLWRASTSAANLGTEACDERSAMNVATIALLPAAALMRAKASRAWRTPGSTRGGWCQHGNRNKQTVREGQRLLFGYAMGGFFHATLTVVQNIATVVQKIALTAIIDQVHNSNICAGPRCFL